MTLCRVHDVCPELVREMGLVVWRRSDDGMTRGGLAPVNGALGKWTQVGGRCPMAWSIFIGSGGKELSLTRGAQLWSFRI